MILIIFTLRNSLQWEYNMSTTLLPSANVLPPPKFANLSNSHEGVHTYMLRDHNKTNSFPCVMLIEIRIGMGHCHALSFKWVTMRLFYIHHDDFGSNVFAIA